MSWLVEQSLKDDSLYEATDFRYRIMHDIPIKGWNISSIKAPELGGMKYFLFNEDLAKEIVAGVQEIVNNLITVHHGLKFQIKGYDS